MAGLVSFAFRYPIEQDQLSTLAERVVSTRISNDPEKAYFLSCLVYLLRFAHENFNLWENITLGIGKQTDEKDSDELWRKDKLWVKVKMIGGSGPRLNFMATSYGVAKVNWKANTRIFLGVIPVHARRDTLDKFNSGNLFTGFNDPKEHPRHFRRSQSIQCYTHATLVFGNILQMRLRDVFAIVRNEAKLEAIANELFEIFDEEQSNVIGDKEFIKFFSHFLHQPLEVTIGRFSESATTDRKIHKSEFKLIFEKFLEDWLTDEISKRLVFFWNHVLNTVAQFPADLRTHFQLDTQSQQDMLERFLTSSDEGRRIGWTRFLHLQHNLDSALHRPKTSEKIVRQKFREISRNGIVSVEVYMNEFTKGLNDVLEFLADWDAFRKTSDGISNKW